MGESVVDEREVARFGDVRRRRCCLSGNPRSSFTSAANLRTVILSHSFSRMIDRRRLAGLDKCAFLRG
jgi:transcriptional regulator NrdR family protein